MGVSHGNGQASLEEGMVRVDVETEKIDEVPRNVYAVSSPNPFRALEDIIREEDDVGHLVNGVLEDDQEGNTDDSNNFSEDRENLDKVEDFEVEAQDIFVAEEPQDLGVAGEVPVNEDDIVKETLVELQGDKGQLIVPVFEPVRNELSRSKSTGDLRTVPLRTDILGQALDSDTEEGEFVEQERIHMVTIETDSSLSQQH